MKKVKPAIPIVGMKVKLGDEFEGIIVGTDEEPKLEVESSCCLRKVGTIGRYLNAGQTYSLIDTDEDDAYFKDYVVPDGEVNEEARVNGGSQVILQLCIDEKTNKLEYLDIDLDS
jgi:hypothetical protein